MCLIALSQSIWAYQSGEPTLFPNLKSSDLYRERSRARCVSEGGSTSYQPQPSASFPHSHPFI